MANMYLIYHIITKVCEKADELNIIVTSDLARDMITGRRTLIFKFTKNGEVIDEVIDEYTIDYTEDVDVLVNHIVKKMEGLV